MAKLNSRKLANVERKIAQAIENVHEYTSVPNHFTFDGFDTSMILVSRTTSDEHYPCLSIPVFVDPLRHYSISLDRLIRMQKIIGATYVQIVHWPDDSHVNFYFD